MSGETANPSTMSGASATGASATGASPSPGLSSSASPGLGPSVVPSSELTLLWSDEFDEPVGTPPNPARWRHALGDGTADGIPGWGNNELETYTDDPANVATDGHGNLAIRARVAEPGLACWNGACRYTSGRILGQDRIAVEYGRIETRARVPAGAGLWPAFWALGGNVEDAGWPRCGEIDIMENVGRQPNRLYGTIHGPGYSGSANFGRPIELEEPLAADFHVFAIDWEPGRILWSFDGREYHRATPADVAPNPWPFDQPFFLLLNLAVGGNLGGPVAPDTVFPAELLVDYVRVYAAAD